jgi:hypothetical protein
VFFSSERRRDMERDCSTGDDLKPLDRLLDEKMEEFNSGADRSCDRDLDTMIWDLGDFENEEAPEEAAEYEEAVPIEEELVEGELVTRRKSRSSKKTGSTFREIRQTGHPLTAGVKLATARALGPDSGRKSRKPAPARPVGKQSNNGGKTRRAKG